ncbi:pirin family protein [Vibrio sp. VB16]|uniref:pirin family protein n=1 Tax=Vibrio sp. VB16 TaxID=2785746 RepID=UPI0018A08756|nr:pirin family protein [Vibrio sp. VB16]UGA53570.1 pirin family protein [Vibrio sp. VB16]
MKQITSVATANPSKVGPFDIVRALPNKGVDSVGPIVFLDHMPEKIYAPGELPATDGSFAHPHRGIATFTYLVKGELNHLDSHSGHGVVKAGGVQWMNAGNGIIHDEGFPAQLRLEGGSFYSFQFWVNLPSKNKAENPDYMPVQSEQLPLIELHGGAGTVKVLLGEFQGECSPIPAFTEQFIWHLSLNANQTITIPTRAGHEYGGYLPMSSAKVSGDVVLQKEFFLFDESEGDIVVENPLNHPIDVLLFGGEPYREAVVSHGPFIMNSVEEIQTAYTDFYEGKYGNINYDVPGL